MLVDQLSLLKQLLVLLIADVLPLNLLPALDFVKGGDDASELILFEVNLLQRGGAFAKGAL